MKLKDAVKVFGTKAAVADVLKIRPQNVAKWDAVPQCHRATLVIAAAGKLRASEDDVAAWKTTVAKLQEAINLAA